MIMQHTRARYIQGHQLLLGAATVVDHREFAFACKRSSAVSANNVSE